MSLKKKAISLLLTGTLAVTALAPTALAGTDYVNYQYYLDFPKAAEGYQLVKQIEYDNFGLNENPEFDVYLTTLYTYNQSNQLIEKKERYHFEDDGRTIEYTYDTQGRLVTVDGRTLEYNNKNEVIKDSWVNHDVDGSESPEYITYKYDEHHNIIQETDYWSYSGEVIEAGQYNRYTYGNSGEILSKEIYYGDPAKYTYDYKYTYQYDDTGRLQKETYIRHTEDENQNYIDKINSIYDYKYDSVGNLIKKEERSEEGYLLGYINYEYEKIDEKEEVEATPVNGAPQISANAEISEDLKGAVEKISVEGLPESKGEFDETTLNSAKSQAATELKVDSDSINLYAQTYLQIKSAEYDKDNGTYSVDMQPMVRLIASTASSKDGFNFDSGDSKNSIVYGEPKELTITDPVEVSIPLPTDFTTEAKAYVQHKDYEYDAEVKGGSAIFTDPHGFSEFTVTKESNASAEMNGTKYLDLQKAVDNVQNDGTITILKDSSATVNTATTFKVKKEEGQTVHITAATGYSLNASGPDESGITTYTVTKNTNRPSGSTHTAYVPDITNSENGTVSVYPKSATASMQITITVTPDEGYQTENLTVTDANGNTVNVTDNGDGTYTFIQPKSKVTITATFSEIAQEPDTPDTPDEPDEPDTPDTPDEPDKPDTPDEPNTPDIPDEPDASDKSVTNIFTDVSDDWYTEGVQYMYDNGLMVGVSDTVFGINTTVSRAMVAQILYANADKPQVTETSKFTDAPAGKWYTEAVAWAANNGIVSGYGDGTFRPNQAVTREELATMLYGAEDKPTVTGSLGDYPDQSDISGWAKSAVLWAVQKGIITGDTSGTKIVLNPKNNATRAQLAAMMMQYIGK